MQRTLAAQRIASPLYDIQGNRAVLHLHKGQRPAWNSSARYTWIIAGTQSGKTSFGSWWLAREIERCGEGDYLAVTATYDLFKLKMLPEMLNVFCSILGTWEWHGSDRCLYRPGTRYRVILRSANVPEGLESVTAKAAWLDECGQDNFRMLSWEAVQRRLSLSGGRVLGTTTPYNLGWLKREVYDRWLAGDAAHQVIQFPSTYNPIFPIEEYERQRDLLPAWKFNMYYNGLFDTPPGLIYSDLHSYHIIPDFAIPQSFPRYVGVDFGPIHTATVWIAEDLDKEVYYVYRETIEGDKTTKEHVAYLRDLQGSENVVAWIGGARGEKQYRWDWRDAGIPVMAPGVVDVESGIDRVIGLLKEKRLYIFESCRQLIDEFGIYSRTVDEYGQPTDAIKDKEAFHLLDALRYVAQGLYVSEVSVMENPFYD